MWFYCNKRGIEFIYFKKILENKLSALNRNHTVSISDIFKIDACCSDNSITTATANLLYHCNAGCVPVTARLVSLVLSYHHL